MKFLRKQIEQQRKCPIENNFNRRVWHKVWFHNAARVWSLVKGNVMESK